MFLECQVVQDSKGYLGSNLVTQSCLTLLGLHGL